jgi:predicted DNA-binding protein with PD1-like motif
MGKIRGYEELQQNSGEEEEEEEGNNKRRTPRGRPPGSKNKTKPPIIVTSDSPNSLRSHLLEVSGGADIIESLSNYASSRGRGVCVLSGSGTVNNVTIHSSVSGSDVLTLHGPFHILSLSGTVLPPPAPPGSGGLSIFIGVGQGQVVGGRVVGPLMASGAVLLMAASFANAVFERLPLDQDEDDEPDDNDNENDGDDSAAVIPVQQSRSQSSEITGGGSTANVGAGHGNGNGNAFSFLRSSKEI